MSSGLPKPVVLRVVPDAGRSPAPTAAIAPDCRHYRGDRPCVMNRLCAGCSAFEPYSHRVAIIKLGALGDVIRTLCLLPSLREQWPQAHVTWVTSDAGRAMIDSHPLIDRVLTFSAVTAMVLAAERFDTVISLDKEPEPCALAMSLRAATKLGVGWSEHGTPVPLNPEAEHYFHLGLSDELKFHRNTRSYPRLVHEALGWRYHGQRYELPVDARAARHVREALVDAGWRPEGRTLGVNVGAGTAFANKMWPVDRIARVIELLIERDPDAQALLLGGEAERPLIDHLLARLLTARRADGRRVIDGGSIPWRVAQSTPQRAFVALVNECDALFTGDTMAMHVAIARRVPVVAVFGPTCEQEIDLFGLGEKLVARVACGPCYKRVCDHDDQCVRAIDEQDAVDALLRQLSAASSAGDAERIPLRQAA